PRRAGVSSFGIGGTNAHAVLEEAPQRRPSGGPAAPGEPQLLAISARAPEALRTLVERYRDRLRTEADAPARWQVAAGAALRRAHHDHRLAVVIDPGAADPAAPLDACLAGGGVRPPAGRRPKVVFVFPGQGSQWVGMGRRLLAGEPVFRRALEACDGAIRRSASWSLLEVLAADESASRLGELDVVQPTLFALQVALAALWRSWGVEPDALIGHSMGEVAAACVAGALSLDDAARVICRRSRLALQVRGRGAMAVVELSAADAAAALAGVTEVAVAARNSPRSTVLSGDARALDAVLERLEAQGVFCRRVKVDFASHCSQVDPLLPELQALLADIRPRAGEVPIYSTVEGRLTDGAGLDAGYWVRNLRQPVLLADMVEQARRDGHDFFLEVSPHPILVPSVADCLAGGDAPAVASLRRDESERGALLATLAAFYERGGNVSWEALFPGGGGFVELPTYPWQRERYWIDPVAPAAAPALARDGAAHPVLGEPLCSSLHPGTTFWPCRPAGVPPGDRLQGEATLPAALFLDLAWAAGSGARLEDVAFDAGGAWNEGETLQLALAPAGSDGAIFRISSAAKPAAGTWAVLAAGRATSLDPGPPARIDLAAIRARCGEPVTAEAFDRERREAGFVPAGGAKILGEILRRDGELLARLEPPPDAGFRVHPALLDACFQALAAAAPRTEGGPIPALPSGVDAVELHARPEGELWLHAALSSLPVGVPSAARLAGDVTVSDGAGRPVLALRGLRARWPVEHWLYEVRWEKAEAAPSAGAAGPWLLAGGGDRDGVAEALGQALAAGGETVVREPAGELRPREVVYLEGLAAQLGPEASGEEMSQAATEACAGLVRLVQTLEGWGDPLPRLTVVTRGAQPTGAATSAAPVQAPLWGLAAVIGNEHPELRCRIVDLDPAVPGEQELAALVRELRGGDREDKVALRGEERRVARLVRRPPPVLPAPRPAPVRAAGTYLVTGGLG
ncbi:MAG TPA: polyketide synthase, partial [Acidobacteria bacterium]|nr:polyketide synthase [Acidobacteriota bacterium]